MVEIAIFLDHPDVFFDEDTPKCLQKLGGVTLIEHLYVQIKKIKQVSTIYLIYFSNKLKHYLLQNNQDDRFVLIQQDSLDSIYDSLQKIYLFNLKNNPIVFAYIDTFLINNNIFFELIESAKKDVIVYKYSKEIDTRITYHALIYREQLKKLVNIDAFKIADINQLILWFINEEKVKYIHIEKKEKDCFIYNNFDLLQLEKTYQKQNIENLSKKGVIFFDDFSFSCRGLLQVGKKVIIDQQVLIEGNVQLGNNVFIGKGVILKNCIIKDDVIIKPYSVIEGSVIGEKCIVGPYARLREGNELNKNVQIGNFVEIKKTKIDDNTKANHLSYIGDSIVGKNVNIGAGVITCNYDGKKKHTTTIADNVFVGSDTQFIAPVSVGENSVIAAGTTLTKNVSSNKLVFSRVKQSNIDKKNIVK